MNEDAEKNKDIYKTRETLLERIKNKQDDASWEDFVFYYRKFIYFICRKMSLNHHDSEEIVQKVLMISWEKLPEFVYNEKKNFRGWLCQLTKNCVKDFYRVVNRHNTKIEKAAEADSANVLRALPDIEQIAEEEWTTYIASMAMLNIRDKFSDKVFDIFDRLKKGESTKAISDDLGINLNTVNVYKKRVIAKLREEINRLNHELG
jgi:RNA polymerase sigma factor (sigma-70 family)